MFKDWALVVKGDNGVLAGLVTGAEIEISGVSSPVWSIEANKSSRALMWMGWMDGWIRVLPYWVEYLNP